MLRVLRRPGASAASSFVKWANVRRGLPLQQQQHYFSNEPPELADPIIDVAAFQASLQTHAQNIHDSLCIKGFYTTPESYSILPKDTIAIMRKQSINLREMGRFEQSWSEKIDAISGKVTRFDKDGVFACEPDGRDYDTAPDLIMYMSVLLQTLPELLNGHSINSNEDFGLSVSSFNAKLAVTSPGVVHILCT